MISYSGDESYQAIDCTGTENQKQRNKTLHCVSRSSHL